MVSQSEYTDFMGRYHNGAARIFEGQVCKMRKKGIMYGRILDAEAFSKSSVFRETFFNSLFFGEKALQ